MTTSLSTAGPDSGAAPQGHPAAAGRVNHRFGVGCAGPGRREDGQHTGWQGAVVQAAQFGHGCFRRRGEVGDVVPRIDDQHGRCAAACWLRAGPKKATCDGSADETGDTSEMGAIGGGERRVQVCTVERHHAPHHPPAREHHSQLVGEPETRKHQVTVSPASFRVAVGVHRQDADRWCPLGHVGEGVDVRWPVLDGGELLVADSQRAGLRRPRHQPCCRVGERETREVERYVAGHRRVPARRVQPDGARRPCSRPAHPAAHAMVCSAPDHSGPTGALDKIPTSWDTAQNSERATVPA